MWVSKELKEKAKAAFKANYWRCVLAGLIMTIILGSSVSITGLAGGNRSAVLPHTSNQT